MKHTVGIIGYGNMGSAIAQRLKAQYSVYIFDKDKSKTTNLKGIKAADNIADLLSQVKVAILAVKPQDFDLVLSEVADCIEGKLVISIAAGISTGYIEKVLRGARVVRAMPNIGAKIGKAQTCLCRGKNVKEGDLSLAKELFDCLGKTWIMEEEMMDAATAISGSGPAYIFYDMEVRKIDPKNLPESAEKSYIERLTKAAERVGFDHQRASELAASTSATSISLSVQNGITPAELKKQVASKGGTTEAALKVLMQGGSWEEAALAAKKRATELSKKE
jgi:pyrroline-5-carboxylate reductase